MLRAGSASESETRRHWDTVEPKARMAGKGGDTGLSAGCRAVSPLRAGVKYRGRKEVTEGLGPHFSLRENRKIIFLEAEKR